MRIDILTLFPNMFDGFLNESIIKRAREKGLVEINIINIRDFTPYKNGQVDDYAFGGGAGMVLMCEPVYNAINSVRDENSRVILTSPRGNKFNQNIAKELKNESHLIIVCGHYEGFDERILNFVDEEISIGDYVLTGGEIPSMAITDAVTRLIDGVITKESLDNESFNDDLLDYPVYTKPREFMGMEVPEILLSGDHKKIDEYRQSERIRLTSKYKKDWSGETMKYILDNKSDKVKSVAENKLKALEIKTKGDNAIKASKVLIVDSELKDIYIKNKINKKLVTILAKMQYILDNDDNDTTNATLVLGEIDRLKSILINKYKEHLKREEFSYLLKKLMIIEEEFKIKYNRKQIYREMLMEDLDEMIGRGRW